MEDREALERWRRDRANERFRVRMIASRGLREVPPEVTMRMAADMAEFGKRWTRVGQ